MDAGKLLGLTNCCGIAVGIAGNLITGASALPCANTCVRGHHVQPLICLSWKFVDNLIQ